MESPSPVDEKCREEDYSSIPEARPEAGPVRVNGVAVVYEITQRRAKYLKPNAFGHKVNEIQVQPGPTL
jgi:hypothetical protein